MNNLPLDQHLRESLQQRKASNNLRNLSLERATVDFYSNDYLGIATHGLNHNFSEGNVLKSGSSGSRLLSGNHKGIEDLEKFTASFHKTEAALIFNSGYDANLGLMGSIAPRESVILYDELCHASILDGIKLSRANTKVKFLHNDLVDLEKKFLEQRDSPCVVVVESVYSMDGDWAPLKDLTQLTARFNAMLIVDEAHATGVFGDHGQGLVQHLKLEEKVFARIHTFGKALGGHGAVVVGTDVLRQYLINFARPFIYTTALPPPAIHFVQEVYNYLNSSAFSNKPLHDVIAYFNERAAKSSLAGWKSSPSPIQALVIGEPLKAKKAASSAVAAGFQVNAILYPSVAKGTERLRICLHSFNTPDQIDKLISVIEDCFPARSGMKQ